MSVLETTEDAVIMLSAATLKVALHVAVWTASQEMDSPAVQLQVCRRHANYWRPYTTGTTLDSDTAVRERGVRQAVQDETVTKILRSETEAKTEIFLLLNFTFNNM